ncbi:MAG: GntR family transcriptional regulator, partial [Gordonia sp. (in: high G+C Gram-positive bacteria)]
MVEKIGPINFAMDMDSALTKGRAIEASLRATIASGAYPEGARLPSARELAAEFGVARGTVTAVVDDLVSEG